MNSSIIWAPSVAVWLIFTQVSDDVLHKAYSSFWLSHSSVEKIKKTRSLRSDDIRSCSLLVPPVIPTLLVRLHLICCCMFQQSWYEIILQQPASWYQMFALHGIPTSMNWIGNALDCWWYPGYWASISPHHDRWNFWIWGHSSIIQKTKQPTLLQTLLMCCIMVLLYNADLSRPVNMWLLRFT